MFSDPSSNPYALSLILGAGGSIGFAAPSKNLSFAFVMNRFNIDPAITTARIGAILDKIAAKIDTDN
jgi:hypothetical protein